MTADSKLQFTGSVSDSGEIQLPARYNSDVAKCFSGKPVIVTVERKRKHRSLNQNAYYWGVVVETIKEAMNEAGEDVLPQDVHEFLKFRFLRIQKIEPDSGELLYERSKSTASLKTFEFALYVDSCTQFAAEYLNVQIPLPNTDYYFPEQLAKEETRGEYLERIGEYLKDIFDEPSLRRYFKQNPDWPNDPDVKALFRNRLNELKTT